MKIYQVTPKKDMRRLNMLSSVLFIGAAILLGATFVFGDIPFKWAFQLIGIVMLTIAVFYFTRYIKRNFVYALEKTDAGVDFTVTEINGRHIITVCRISTDNVIDVYTASANDSLQKKEAIAKAKANNRKFFNYSVDMFGEQYVFLLADECGESVSVKLSYDEQLLALLKAKKE